MTDNKKIRFLAVILLTNIALIITKPANDILILLIVNLAIILSEGIALRRDSKHNQQLNLVTVVNLLLGIFFLVVVLLRFIWQ